MSADNGVYVGKFPLREGEGFEYYVAHAQNIEGTFPEDWERWYEGGKEACLQKAQACQVFTFNNRRSTDYCRGPFTTENEAWVAAREIYELVEYTEYGLALFTYDHPFPEFTLEEANDILWTTNEDGTELPV